MLVVLIDIDEVCKQTSLSRTTVYEMIGCHQFPKQIQVSRGRVAWVASEINEWVKEKISASRGGESPYEKA